METLEGEVLSDAGALDEELFRVALTIRNCIELGERGPRIATKCCCSPLFPCTAFCTSRAANLFRCSIRRSSFQAAAAGCRNVGAWPVLAGEEGQRDLMLSAPIILYDYPQIAPESAGDLFDGTEIDEILALRILTMTDDEKLEVREWRRARPPDSGANRNAPAGAFSEAPRRAARIARRHGGPR